MKKEGSTICTKAFLHKDVKSWAGLPHQSPIVNGIKLTALNDGRVNKAGVVRRHSFKEIADLIEKHL